MSDDSKSESQQQEQKSLISEEQIASEKNSLRSSFFSRSKVKLRSFLNNPYTLFFNNSGPELNYLGFTMRSTLGEKLNLNPTPQTLVMHTLLWNYLDGLQAFGSSAQKAMEYNHHEGQAALLSSFYFLDGVALLLFSCPPWNCRDEAGVLSISGGGWAFAFAMGVDFASASVDHYNNWKRLGFSGWLEDSVNEAIYLKRKVDEVEDEKEKNELDNKYKVLLGKIQARCVIHKTEKTIGQQLAILCDKTGLDPKKILLDESIDPKTKESFNFINGNIEDQVKQAAKDSAMNLVVKALSFAGMSLVAAGGHPLGWQNSWAPDQVFSRGFEMTQMVAVFYLFRFISMCYQQLNAKSKTEETKCEAILRGYGKKILNDKNSSPLVGEGDHRSDEEAVFS